MLKRMTSIGQQQGLENFQSGETFGFDTIARSPFLGWGAWQIGEFDPINYNFTKLMNWTPSYGGGGKQDHDPAYIFTSTTDMANENVGIKLGP